MTYVSYIRLILYGKLVGMFVPIKPRKQPNRRISSKRQCELSVGKWFIHGVWGGVLVGKYAVCFTLFDEYNIININGLYIFNDFNVFDGEYSSILLFR